MAVMLAHSDPLEQYLAQRAHLLTNELEPTIASLWNPVIAAQQAKCACYERPISVGEASRLGLGATLEGLVASGEIQETAGMFYYPAYSVPARQVSIRSAESGSVKLMVGGSVIGEMETWRAMQYAHLGAVHLHRGEGYLVTRSDLMRGIVEMEPFAGNYYTQPIVQSVIESQADLKSEVAGDYRLSLEAVQVTSLVSGYRHVSLKGGCVIGEFALEPQTRTMDTVALRLSVAFGAVKGFEMETAAPAIHGVEHLLATVAPLVAGCDRRDMGSSWYAMSADRLEPTIYLFDLAAGGLGLAEECYAQSRRLLIQARDLVVSCPCQNGCPLCLLAPGCESRNELLSKSGAAAVLDGAVRSLGMA
jgi:DEAD/DEAH box helicase domain-containing protein